MNNNRELTPVLSHVSKIYQMKYFIITIISLFFTAFPAQAYTAKRVLNSSECVELGGEVVNTLEKGCDSDNKFLGEVMGLRCPCVCCKSNINVSDNNVIIPVRIEITDKLRIRDGFVKKKYYGVIQNQKELNRIWSELYDVDNDLNIIFNTNDAPAPQIDFNNYSVIWYANRGSGASFVDSIEVFKEQQNIK